MKAHVPDWAKDVVWYQIFPERFRNGCPASDPRVVAIAPMASYDDGFRALLWPGGIQNKLHLHARRIRIAHPDGGTLDVTAPLPPHMVQTWNLLGFDPDSELDSA